MKIGEAARRVGLSVKAIRYYEDAGLLRSPERRPLSGYREFVPLDLEILRFIKKARRIGFGISEVKAILEVCRRDQTTCAEIRRIVCRKRAVVHREIRKLGALERRLVELDRRMKGRERAGSCVCPAIREL